MSARNDLLSHRLLIDACLENGVYFFWRGPGTLLIAQGGIRTILLEVRRSGAEVLGLDGFELESSGIRPRLDLIYDSSVGPDQDPIAVASSWPANIWVDVTLRLAEAQTT